MQWGHYKMDNFDNFMIHRASYDYQNQGFSVQFGGGYSFDTDGGYPLLRKINLTFNVKRAILLL